MKSEAPGQPLQRRRGTKGIMDPALRRITRSQTRERVVLAVTNPMHLDLIVDNVLSYLPLKSLKNARRVNKNWEKLGNKYFEDKALMRIGRFLDYADDDALKKKDGIFPTRLLCNTSINIDWDNKQLISAVGELFKKDGHKVKTLTLTNAIGTYKTLLFVQHVLRSSPNLQILNLGLCLQYKEKSEIPLLDGGFKFSQLKTLVLSPLCLYVVGLPALSSDHATLKLWVRQLFRAAPNITTLKFVGNLCIGTQSVFQEIVKDEEMGNWLSKLEHLEIDQNRDTSFLPILLKLKCPLKVVRVKCEVKGSMCKAIMDKFAGTLETVQLTVQRDPTGVSFTVPNMPNMKRAISIRFKWY